MIIYLSLLICVAGALIYALTNTKAAELGRCMFWCGLLVFLFQFGNSIQHFPR